MKTVNHETFITVNNLEKKYGTFSALKNVSFEIKQNEIVGVIGPNGAGKSTLFRILCTLLEPSGGEVKLMNCNSVENSVKIRELIGYMPEEGGLYVKHSGETNLRFYTMFYKKCINHNQKIDYYLDMFDLIRNKKVGKYSKGMKQKLLFIKSIVHDPLIILLDEPFSSMDPETRHKIKRILHDKHKEGKVIIISSHSLTDIEGLCDRLLVLKEGKIICDDRAETLYQKFSDYSLEEIFLKLME